MNVLTRVIQWIFEQEDAFRDRAVGREFCVSFDVDEQPCYHLALIMNLFVFIYYICDSN